MSRRLFDLTIKEWQGSFPKEGTSHFIFSATINKGTNSVLTKNMLREFTVFCESNDDNGFSRTVVLKTNNSDVKKNAGSSSVTTLLNTLFSVYDTTTLKVKFDGTILKIENHLQILKDWKKIKKCIEEEYKGNFIRRFIRSVDSRLETEEKMIRDINSFENFGLLFHPIYGKYDNISNIVKEFEFVGINKKYLIRENIKIAELNDTNVILKVKNDKKNSDQLSYSGSYTIHSSSQWIEKVVINIKESYNNENYLSEFNLQQKV